MPKELTHFFIAEQVAANLKDTPYFSSVSAHPHALRIGSLLPDVTFYGITSKTRPVRKWSDTLHGAGNQDTFELIRILASHAQQYGDPYTVALLIGAASHIYADATFHPMIWYFTGDYHSKNKGKAALAQAHHRAFESLMDMVFCADMMGRRTYSIQANWRRCLPHWELGFPSEAFATLFRCNQIIFTQGIAASWQNYGRIQQAVSNKWLANSLHALLPFLPTDAAKYVTLAYCPQFAEQGHILNNAIAYTHPLTGHQVTTTLNEMTKEAVQKTVDLCRRIEPFIFGDTQQPITENGPAMDIQIDAQPSAPSPNFASPALPLLPKSLFS